MFIRHDIEMSCVHSSVHSLTVNSPIVAHRTVRQSTASIWQPFLGELDVLIPLGPLSVNSPDILQLTQLPSFVIFWYYNIHWYTAMIYFVQELQPASPSACVWASWHAYGIQSQAQELQYIYIYIITNPANVVNLNAFESVLTPILTDSSSILSTETRRYFFAAFTCCSNLATRVSSLKASDVPRLLGFCVPSVFLDTNWALETMSESAESGESAVSICIKPLSFGWIPKCDAFRCQA